MDSPLPLLFLFSLLLISTSATLSDDFINCFTSRLAGNSSSSVIYTPTNPSFPTVLQEYIKNRRFNTSSTPKPVVIVTPTSYSHVQSTVICAKSVGLQIKIRSGGHDYEGISYTSSDPTFIVLDMFNLRSITVNAAAQTAFVQTGANLGEVYYRIWENTQGNPLAFPAGVCPTVGVGGHISGGGYGNMLRKFGLAVDHVIDAEIVDVNGRVLNRTSMGEDLFWAIRGGGGGSFGVILSYTLNLVPVPDKVTVFRVMKTLAENATDILFRWQSVAPTMDNNLFMRLLLQPVTVNKVKTARVTFIGEFLGDANTLVGVMNSQFPELGITLSDLTEMTWIQSVLNWANFDYNSSLTILLNRHSDTVNFLKRKSDYVQTPIPKAGLEGLWTKMIQLGKAGMVFNAYGGRMWEIPATDTPFPHRAGNLFKIQYSVNWNDPNTTLGDEYVNQSRELYTYMTPYVSQNPRGAFLNYRDLDIGVTTNGNNSYNEGVVYGMKYFMVNFDRLVKVKTAVDPDNFFRNEQSIPVLPSSTKETESPSGLANTRNIPRLLPWLARILLI